MKPLKLLAMVLCMMVILTSGVLALEVEVSVKVNEQYVQGDAKHLLMDDQVFVVARTLVEAIGGKIEWVPETSGVNIQSGEKRIGLVVGSDQALVNDGVVALDAPVFIRNGRTYLPIRFVMENLDCQVAWNNQTYTVDVVKEGVVVPEDQVFQRAYTDEDLLWLSRIVDVESGDGSLEKKMAIANVVLNRVHSDAFPDSVYGVIFQIDVYKQFPPAHKASFKTLEPDQMSRIAAKKALEGNNNIENCLFFNLKPFTSKADDFYKEIEGDYFYR